MKLFITTPDFSCHGGIRIIIELANRLAERHEVYLHPLKPVSSCDWMKISEKVKITQNSGVSEGCDYMIITSPHAIHFEDAPRSPKIILYLQMLEHLFKPSKRWNDTCHKMYLSPHPMLSISEWNINYMKGIGRTGYTKHIANGINYEDFPIESPTKDGKTVLIEGVVAGNQTKDSHGIALKVARKLKNEGYKILGYSQHPNMQHRSIFDEYYIKPSLEKMNELYSKACVLIKATHYDARSLSPLEAMTKKCVTARAIEKGDDDLIDGYNCLRVGYNEHYLYNISKRLLEDVTLRNKLADNCHKHLKEVCQWDAVIDEFENLMK